MEIRLAAHGIASTLGTDLNVLKPLREASLNDSLLMAFCGSRLLIQT